MDSAHQLLVALAIVLCVAGVTTVVFQRLRQPVARTLHVDERHRSLRAGRGGQPARGHADGEIAEVAGAAERFARSQSPADVFL